MLRSGRLLPQVNHTVLYLVPQKVVPESVDDYRPIALCNVLYRILAKLLSNRLKPLLPKIVDPNQCAFIQGRRITDSILLAHELYHNLHSGQGRARMCIKLDLRKAFDSLSRTFLCDVLRSMGFEWTNWIEMCLHATISLNINGEPNTSFSSSNGVRQGAPYPCTFSSWQCKLSQPC